MSDKYRDPSQIPIDPAAVTAALVIIGLTITWFLLERNFESLIALIAAFSGVFTYISIKSRRVNWLLAGVVVIVALGCLYLVRDTVTQTPISKVTITKVSYEGIGKKRA